MMDSKREKLETAPLADDGVLESSEFYYSEYFTRNYGYFDNWDDFFKDWKENHESTEDKRPDYVWATEPCELTLSAESIVEEATENLYDGAFYDVSVDKMNELQSYLDEWCKTCGVEETYFPSDYKVRIPWEEYELNY